MKKALGILLVASVLLSGCIVQEKHKPNELVFKDTLLHFRSDLRQAQKIEVFPSEQELANMLLSEKVNGIVIALPNVSKAGYYGVAAYELAYKLTFIYNSMYAPFTSPRVYTKNNFTCLYYPDFDKNICIGKKIYSSREELKGNESLVVIALLGEGLANETRLVANLERGVVFVKGKSFSAKNGYTDLDLAVDKLLLVLFQHLAR